MLSALMQIAVPPRRKISRRIYRSLPDVAEDPNTSASTVSLPQFSGRSNERNIQVSQIMQGSSQQPVDIKQAMQLLNPSMRWQFARAAEGRGYSKTVCEHVLQLMNCAWKKGHLAASLVWMSRSPLLPTATVRNPTLSAYSQCCSLRHLPNARACNTGIYRPIQAVRRLRAISSADEPANNAKMVMLSRLSRLHVPPAAVDRLRNIETDPKAPDLARRTFQATYAPTRWRAIGYHPLFRGVRLGQVLRRFFDDPVILPHPQPMYGSLGKTV